MGVREAVIRLQSYYFPALGRPELPGGGMAMAASAIEPGEETITYSYDAADRLTGATYSSGDSYGYTYDPVGNRTTLETVLGGVSDSTSYTYDDGDRILTVDGVAYAHDNRGNLTSDGTWTYTYDGAGRMVRAEKPGSVHTYTYNGDGLLVSETIDGVETVFTWDLALDVPQVLATSDGAKNLYGLERIGVEQGGAWRYTLADALGSVRQWADPAGAVLGVQSYWPFGEPRDPVATPPWGFTGEWHDPAGMVYLRARWFSVALGRFSQVDPVGGEMLTPGTLHAYAYGLNNPLRFSDPSGQWEFEDVEPKRDPPKWTRATLAGAVFVVARVIMGEEGDQPERLQRAAGWTLRNRVEDNWAEGRPDPYQYCAERGYAPISTKRARELEAAGDVKWVMATGIALSILVGDRYNPQCNPMVHNPNATYMVNISGDAGPNGPVAKYTAWLENYAPSDSAPPYVGPGMYDTLRGYGTTLVSYGPRAPEDSDWFPSKLAEYDFPSGNMALARQIFLDVQTSYQ